MSESTAATVTFLMTDIEDSTSLWEREPEAMRTAVAQHQEIITAAVVAHGGWVVKDRGEGDSVFAVFAAPADAVSAAVALQIAFLGKRWPVAVPICVRAAIHTGQAEHRAGDYYGVEVNRCARLRSLAHGGQVLLSGDTALAAGRDLPPGVSTKPLGSYRLRGLRAPELILQILHAELPRDFPPLAATGIGISIQWRPALEQARRELDEISLWRGDLPGTQRERLRRLTGLIQRWTVETHTDYQRGRSVDLDTVELGLGVIEKLMSLEPQTASLGMSLAQLQADRGDYLGALVQTQQAITIAGAARSEQVLFAATVLMNVGEIERSRTLYTLVEHACGRGQRPAGLLVPLAEEERLRQSFQARKFLWQWLPDYEQRKWAVIASSPRLLRTARELGPLEEATVLHRWGRALHDVSKGTRRSRLLIVAKETLERARRCAGEQANPFAYLAEYHLAKDLHDDVAAERLWNECLQMIPGYGEGLGAHRLYVEGRRLRQEGKLLDADESLSMALGIWKRHPYRRGGLDVLVELGLVHATMDLGTQAAARATAYFAAAEEIAARYFPALRGRIAQYREACAARCGWNARRIEDAVVEQRLAAPLLFEPFRLDLGPLNPSPRSPLAGVSRFLLHHGRELAVLGRPD